MPMLPESRNDAAVTPDLAAPFTIGATDRGAMKGSQGAYKRESRPVSLGSGVQPALAGVYPHPIPPDKGNRR